MSSPDRGGGTPTRTVSSNRNRVVTVPSWARNLPPEFPDDDDDDEPRPSFTKPPSNPRNRSLSSVFRPPPPPTPPGAALGPHDANSEASTSSSPSPTHPPSVTPRPPPQAAFHTSEFQRQSTHPGPGGGDKWWTFTLPGKYLDKVHDYVQANSGSAGDDLERAKEKGNGSGDDGRRRSRLGRGEKDSLDRDETPRHHHHHHHQMTMSARLPGTSNVFSLNQTQTPGWSSPWQPFHRASGDFSDAFHFQPETPGPKTRYVRFQEFLLNNVFAPLVFRIGNLILVTCTLALGTRIRVEERRSDLIGVMGSSTLTAICVCPLALVHVFTTVYIEYFGRPIGLWPIRTKMLHTLTELIFVCLFASLLSLCFDDLFTSPLACTSWNPYARFSLTPIDAGSSKVEGTLADQICSEQIALVVFVFWSLMLYVAVLVVSLFRIFARVKR